MAGHPLSARREKTDAGLPRSILDHRCCDRDGANGPPLLLLRGDHQILERLLTVRLRTPWGLLGNRLVHPQAIPTYPR